MIMFPGYLKSLEAEEYETYRASLPNDVHPEPNLYAVYRKQEIDAGRKPKIKLQWACDRARDVLEDEPQEIKDRVREKCEAYRTKKILVIECEPDDDYDEELENKPKPPETPVDEKADDKEQKLLEERKRFV